MSKPTSKPTGKLTSKVMSALTGILASVLVCIPAVMYGQDGLSALDTTLAFDKNGTVELEVITGSVRVTTWDRNMIRVHVTTTGKAVFDFDANRTRASLTDERRGAGSVICEVTVPLAARVRVTSVAAPITITGIAGLASIHSVSGPVDVTGSPRRIDIENVSGKVHVAGTPAEVNINGVSSDISVEGATGRVNIESVTGPVRVAATRSPRINVTTVSGPLIYDGTFDPDGRYDMESHSGAVTLTLADKANATIEVETFSGTVKTSYPNATRRAEDPGEASTNFRYTLGLGGAKVNVTTFSGKVSITQK
jgi:hypothetical protein